MNKTKQVLNSIRTLLNIEPELEMLAEATLEDGTKIATDDEEWREGAMAFVISEDGEKMPLPTGEYKTDDGLTMMVEDGEIISVSKVEVVEEAAGTEEKKEEEEEKLSTEIDLSTFCTKEQLLEALETLHVELSTKIEEVLNENSNLKNELSKISKLSAVKPIKHSAQKLQSKNIETGNSVFDMILKLKQEN
tara:strand:+ start:8226 stop:8801 length:576 start_codon:yes stop_codon:yes gene_type:complete